MSEVSPPPNIVTITAAAHARLVELRDQQNDPNRQGLRLRVAEIDDDHVHHDLRFDSVTKAAYTDEIRTHDGLKVIIAAADVPLLEGAILDFTAAEGLVVRNTTLPRVRSEDDLIDGDDLACEIRDLIATAVNPMLAEHGGYVTLVGHDGGGTVFLTMGGGCQGCSLSAATMRDGVRGMLSERLPAVQRVRDITDHLAGKNPYFRPSDTGPIHDEETHDHSAG